MDIPFLLPMTNNTNGTPSLSSAVSEDSNSTIDVVGIGNSSSARLDSETSSVSSSLIREVPDEIIVELIEVTRPVNCNRLEDERSREQCLRSEMIALKRSLENLINCPVSDEEKSSFKADLKELKQKFRLFLDRFKQGPKPTNPTSSGLKLVYGQPMHGDQSTYLTCDLISRTANLVDQTNATTNATGPTESAASSVGPAGPTESAARSAGPAKSRDEQRQRPIPATRSPADEPKKKSGESNNRKTGEGGQSKDGNQEVHNDKNDRNQEVTIINLVSSDEEEPEDQPRIFVNPSGPIVIDISSDAPSDEISPSRRPAVDRPLDAPSGQQSDRHEASSGCRLAHFQRPDTSSDDDDLINPTNEVFDIVKDPPKRPKELRRPESPKKPKQLVSYKEPSSPSVSSEWSSSDGEFYWDSEHRVPSDQYTKRKNELKLQKFRKLARLENCFSESSERNDPSYIPRITTDNFIENTVWKLGKSRKRRLGPRSRMPF